jgi:hypothetical protein
MNHCVNAKSFSLLNDLAAYIDDHGAFREGFYGSYAPATYLLGITGNNRDNDAIPYSEATAAERIRQYAIIESARSLNVEHITETSGTAEYENGFPHKRINNAPLAAYIRKNPYNAEKIVQLVNERGIDIVGFGGRTLDELLDNVSGTATPLSGGVL